MVQAEVTCHNAHNRSVMPMSPPHLNTFRHGSSSFSQSFCSLFITAALLQVFLFTAAATCWAVEAASSLLAGKASILPPGTRMD